jgi:hypothetical protein
MISGRPSIGNNDQCDPDNLTTEDMIGKFVGAFYESKDN